MATSRRLRDVVFRKMSRPGWRPWLANVPLVSLTMVALVLLTSALVSLLPGPKDVRTIAGFVAGFFSYHAAWVVVGWLHVKRQRWAMRAMYRGL